MISHAFGENNVLPKYSVTRVNWFQREPGGTTVFVKPAVDTTSGLQVQHSCTDPDGGSAEIRSRGHVPPGV
jgi:hypothetical protein